MLNSEIQDNKKIRNIRKMKAIVYKKYGPPEVLQLEEIEVPSPKKNEVLIRIHSTTVTPADLMLRSGKFPLLFWLPVRIMYGIRKPRNLIPGYELAGVVERVGEDVKLFSKGDHVFGASMRRMSCNAEFICLPEKSALTVKPANIGFDEAAAIADSSCTALHFLRKGNIQSGQKVLIYGASGSIGTVAVQLAKYFGAEVTGVCSSTNTQLVKSIGADKVMDYTAKDFRLGTEVYDMIFDTVGKSCFSDCIRSLKPEGTYLSAAMKLSSRIRGKWISFTSGKQVKAGFSSSNVEDLTFIKGLIEGGEIKPVKDRSYSLDQIVEAHGYVSKGHKRGTVVISVKG